jgi:hypothetical protein
MLKFASNAFYVILHIMFSYDVVLNLNGQEHNDRTYKANFPISLTSRPTTAILLVQYLGDINL